MMQAPIRCIMGPTASGKTAYAMELCRESHYEIISVDSAMIYKSLSIGAAKPGAQELLSAPHHLIDIIEPNHAYSAAQFVNDVVRLVTDIRSRGNEPLLVGGTMLYFRALQVGLSVLPESDPQVRAALEKEMQESGLEGLYSRLQKVDPEAAERINPHDPQRIFRALEVYDMSGIALTQWWHNGQVAPQFTYENIALLPNDRAVLHQRIADRFDHMLASGFIDEVKVLRARGDLDLSMPSMRSVGYRQVWLYLDGEYTYDEMREKAIIATRQLAKRQMTWLRNWPHPCTVIAF